VKDAAESVAGIAADIDVMAEELVPEDEDGDEAASAEGEHGEC
jgi:hypothetical protein